MKTMEQQDRPEMAELWRERFYAGWGDPLRPHVRHRLEGYLSVRWAIVGEEDVIRPGPCVIHVVTRMQHTVSDKTAEFYPCDNGEPQRCAACYDLPLGTDDVSVQIIAGGEREATKRAVDLSREMESSMARGASLLRGRMMRAWLSGPEIPKLTPRELEDRHSEVFRSVHLRSPTIAEFEADLAWLNNYLAGPPAGVKTKKAEAAP